jgi:LTXXQ motif family protein
MTAIRILSVAFAAGLAAFAATGAVFAQDDSDKASGSMMDQKPGGGMMDQKSGGGSMMDQKSGGGSMMDQKSGGGMMGHGMMGHGMMMGHHGMMGGMGSGDVCGRMTAHMDGRLAYLKAELKITPEQESLWNDYATAVKDNAKTIGERCTAMMAQDDDKMPSLPERLDDHEQFMMARLDALRSVGKALKPLYAALSDEQKQLADQFIKGSTGMM